ncbi:glycosyl transferase group 1 [Rahnella aceris]|uniref:Glycosyl transferase group 1 n=1 Tax=Rahnella sp. (strain Y9602) TaxID=2703885 RepID=A0A0H3FGJ6_RAHSY|nr:glycosyltransferase [Rahnella aceris]ADW75183.1 glycosyl transferase group 1 [Rahnella aceris]AZP52385.1 glycosyltransferase [Rahnella aquatilis]
MKVLFFLYKFPVLSETFILNQIAYFINNGCDVSIVSVFPGDIGIEHNVIKKFCLLNKVQYLLDKEPNGKVARILWRVKSLIPALLIPRVIKSINFKKYGYYSKVLLLPQILSKNKNSIQTDIIISHFGTTAVLASQLRRLGFLKGKLAAVFHGNEISQTRILNLFYDNYKELYDEAEFILPVSQLWANKIKAISGHDDNIHVIRMGISVEKFSFQPRTILVNTIRLLSIARLTEKKGISVAINACLLLKQNNIDFDYTIIGDGPLRKELESQVENLGLGDKIVFLGAQTQETVSQYLNNSDVFLLPSVTATDGDMEGIPVAIMEAMAIGIPVISTFHSGIPELIENRVSGFLVNENDAESIADVVIEIINEPTILFSICHNAKQKIDDEFDQDKSYSKMLNILSNRF